MGEDRERHGEHRRSPKEKLLPASQSLGARIAQNTDGAVQPELYSTPPKVIGNHYHLRASGHVIDPTISQFLQTPPESPAIFVAPLEALPEALAAFGEANGGFKGGMSGMDIFNMYFRNAIQAPFRLKSTPVPNGRMKWEW